MGTTTIVKGKTLFGNKKQVTKDSTTLSSRQQIKALKIKEGAKNARTIQRGKTIRSIARTAGNMFAAQQARKASEAKAYSSLINSGVTKQNVEADSDSGVTTTGGGDSWRTD